jgi:hypothetical protein
MRVLLDAYVAVDASGTFSETKRQVGLLRMLQAGVIVSDYATLIMEILKDNARLLRFLVFELDRTISIVDGYRQTAKHREAEYSPKSDAHRIAHLFQTDRD